jgi:ferredoxin/flavodoxin---NADP+ reductase
VARVAALSTRSTGTSALPGFDIPSTLGDRIHLGSPPTEPRGKDILVVGGNEDAVVCALDLIDREARVVLALGGADPSRLSRLARRRLLRVEAERRATILWVSSPDSIEDIGGYPMAYFDDRRTPDLQFDHVVIRLGATTSSPGSGMTVATDEALLGKVYWWDASGNRVAESESVVVTTPGEAWRSIRGRHFPQIPETPPHPRVWRKDDAELIEELRSRHYNAVLTHFERTHSDLWVLRVRGDHGETAHIPGQYSTLGLGYWEPRVDTARDPAFAKRWDKLIRRSYSISSPIFDSDGYLFDQAQAEELEFYVVLVHPSAGRVPALTPRLALKGVGDRLYLGPKVAGRYTLAPVRDPQRQVVFFATGTGEAPHNSMATELLRRGHTGPIVSAVSVRHHADLGYLDANRRLEERFSNYHYLPIVTRDPAAVRKMYIQDVVAEDVLMSTFGVKLDPERTDVYMCGNPAMIGLPTWAEDGTVSFPATLGVCQLLHERGFEIDRRGFVGNVHYEEYW